MAKKQTEIKKREFIDSNGEKWVQTSPDDLFSIKELNEVFEAVERERSSNEIVLARIDFKTVNKEYYETMNDLKKRLDRKEELLKRLITESKRVIKRKNDMMLDMIAYIRQLQILVAQKSVTPEMLRGINLSAVFAPPAEEIREEETLYERVHEVALSDDGEEEPA